MNVNAALFPDDHRMGWGAVLRDHNGAFILSVSEGVPGFPTPELAEGFAIRRAVSVLRELGFHKCVLESDCLSMIQRINSSVQDRSLVGIVVHDIKVLAKGFISCSFKHVNRSLNVAAHILARASRRDVCNFSFHVIPDLIRAELCNGVI
jgi:ribonuclease HI